jgi:phage terminase large subunit-like protein
VSYLATKNLVKTTSRDPVTTYARNVVQGKIIAGPHVRAACQRHLDDLKNAPSRGFFFDLDKVNRVIGFFRDVLKLNGGDYEGLPYELLDWQIFVNGSLVGWVDAEGQRRFRVAYIETAKGSGKSPMVAGLGLYALVADNEPRAEIYAAATKKDQAMIMFRDAVAMVKLSPALSQVISMSGGAGKEWNLAYHKSGGFFRPISSDDGQSGPRPYFGICDEVHEHRSDTVIEMLRAGLKHRKQGMVLMITNSGYDKTSVCWQYHEAAINACNTRDTEAAGFNDQLFGYVCAIDEGDKPLEDESCWPKANPSLKYGLPGYAYLREQVTEARGMNSKQALVRRLNFCEWTEADNPWISGQQWMACQDKEYDQALLAGRKCYGGLDLSSSLDLTAFVLLFEPTPSDPYWRLQSHFWLPNEGLMQKAEKDKVPYILWREKGYLNTTKGAAIKKLDVAYKIATEIVKPYKLQVIAYDRYDINDFKAALDQEGLTLPLVEFGQGYKSMGPAVNALETMIVNKTMRHNGNPVMTWCAANAVIDTDPAGWRKVTKAKATGRVDGMVAALMAAGTVNTKTSGDINDFIYNPIIG